MNRAWERGREQGLKERSDEVELLRRALKPLAEAAEGFLWVEEKDIDAEGAFLWAQSGPDAKQISVRDALFARDVLAGKKTS